MATRDVTLRPGESALTIFPDSDGEKLLIRVIHNFEDGCELNEDDRIFYSLLLRGMAYLAVTDPELLMSAGMESHEDGALAAVNATEHLDPNIVNNPELLKDVTPAGSA